MIASPDSRPPACRFCGGPPRRRYAMGDFQIHQCRRCGAGFAHPMPSTETLGRLYDGFLPHLAAGMAPGIEAAMARLFPDLGLTAGAGLRMLDVGGGGGFYSLAFQRLGYGEAVYVDLDPRSCRFARQTLHLAGVRCGDATALTPRDCGRFDFIYSRHLIEHLPEPTAFLDAMAPLLAPGGRLVVQCPNGESIEYLAYPASTLRGRMAAIGAATGWPAGRVYRQWLTGGMLHGIDPPRHLWAITGRAIRSWARRRGLACTLRTRPLWDRAYSPGYRPRRVGDRFQATLGRCVLSAIRGGAHLVAIVRKTAAPRRRGG